MLLRLGVNDLVTDTEAAGLPLSWPGPSPVPPQSVQLEVMELSMASEKKTEAPSPREAEMLRAYFAHPRRDLEQLHGARVW